MILGVMFTFSVCLLWLILTQDQDVRTTHLQIEEMQRIINWQSAEIERLHEAETGGASGSRFTKPLESGSRFQQISDADLEEIALWMDIIDQKIFGEILLALNDVENGRYLEWGSGGSTRFAAKYITRPGARAYSIEHNPPWCTKMQEDPLVIQAIERGNMYGIFTLAISFFVF